jgi:RimJ/RimL family protein N-acetyltransferase
MKINHCGITLHRLQESHIETVRRWRNHPEVAGYMCFGDNITPEMQRIWFEKINTVYNYFFIIEYQSEWVGLIDLKNVDFQTHSADSGLLLAPGAWRESPLPVWASVVLLHFGFCYLGLQTVRIQMKSDNFRARDYNRALGFIEQAEVKTPGNEVVLAELSAENYWKHSGKIRNAVYRLTRDSQARLVFEPNRLPIDAKILNLLPNR